MTSWGEGAGDGATVAGTSNETSDGRTVHQNWMIPADRTVKLILNGRPRCRLMERLAER
jgi:hypothetical protein